MAAGGMMTMAAVAVVGGIMSSMSASKGRKEAAAAAAAAYRELEKIGLPPDLSKEVIMKQFSNEGILTPELEQDINIQASQVAQIKEDPSLRAAQMESLDMLGQVSRGGLRAEDRGAFNDLLRQTQRDSEAKRQQILQQYQSRGMGGSGAELMTQLQSAQAASDQQSASADKMAAQASINALAANKDRLQGLSGLRTQDMSAAELRARAEDDRNKFMYENSRNLQSSNINRLNQAQQANLINKQRLSEMNTAQANTEVQRQNQAKRDYFQDQMGLATAKANALNKQGTVAQQNSQAKADTISGLAGAIGQGAAAYGSSENSKAATAEENAQRAADRQAYGYKKYNG